MVMYDGQQLDSDAYNDELIDDGRNNVQPTKLCTRYKSIQP